MPDPRADGYPRWVTRVFEVNTREVAPNLYVGGRQAPRVFSRGGLGAVVSLYHPVDDPAGVLEGLPSLYWPFRDGTSVPPGLLDAVLPFVQAHAALPILVHCQAGMSRSASVAYAILRALGMDEVEARRRTWAREGFPLAATLASADTWARRHARRG